MSATKSSSAEKTKETTWSGRRHLLDTKDLTLDEVNHILELAGRYAEGGVAAMPLPAVLKGRPMANVFYENSTRTRSSFEIAGKMLGLNVVNLDVGSSSVAKGESIEDTGRSLVAMGFDVIVQRHSSSGAAHNLASMIGDKVRIVNAGDGANAHPTQALLDALTMLQIKQSLKGIKVAIIGDVAHSRVARSNLWLLTLLGAEVHFCGPPTLMPSFLNQFGHVHVRVEDAIADADFVMVLRLQLERQASGLIPSIYEYSQVFRIDHDRIKLAKPGAKVMHPGPMNRDIEITNALADDPEYSLVERQVANGYFVRMAVLYTLYVHT
ncbi:MAG TPA: aspartate carbamoyltransferase catalytic subunit [Oculatellaceae cyanobacterium]